MMIAPYGGGLSMDIVQRVLKKLEEKNLKVCEKHYPKLVEAFIKGYPRTLLKDRLKELESNGYRVEFGYKDVADEGLLYMLGDTNVAVIPIGTEYVSAIEKIDENNKIVFYEPIDQDDALLLFAEKVDKVEEVYYTIKMMTLEEKYSEIIASWYPKSMREKIKKAIRKGEWEGGPIEVYQVNFTEVYVYVPSKERGFVYNLKDDTYYEPKEYEEIYIQCTFCGYKLSIKVPKGISLNIENFKTWREISIKRKNPFIKVTVETNTISEYYICSKCLLNKFGGIGVLLGGLF